MKTFYLNASGDIEFDAKRSFKMVDEDDELVQCVAVAFKTNKGEWFLNPEEHGFDREVVQTKQYDQVLIMDALYETAFQDPRVATVTEINFDYDKTMRKLSVDFKFTKDDGETLEGAI